ncbi:unnamed protein product [Mycena citricolor]|uniref:Cobalamin-independent methionine synthase MetE C-terminal/archaeal domain-containing protein n=1 Tax=Mycena citricolor TaxID=2018698 RepID=A0AAD2HW92_9AGAR|nr:unnamed protein product [Mycena citricolor]
MPSVLTSSKHTFTFNRADHVGSFLRPSTIHQSRKSFKEGTLDAEGLRVVEDREIAALVEQERAVGIKSISDGEFRREYFHLDFVEHIEGIKITRNTLVGEKNEATVPTISVTGKLRHVKPIQLADFKFLQERVDGSKGEVVKVAIPSPTMVHFRGGRSSIDLAAYPDLDEFFEDLAEVYRQEIKILAEAGCKYLQLDDTNLAYLWWEELQSLSRPMLIVAPLSDLNMREAAAGRGEDLNTLPRQYAQLINAALRDRPAGMTVGIHLCRGNFRSRHFAEGLTSALRWLRADCASLVRNARCRCLLLGMQVVLSDQLAQILIISQSTTNDLVPLNVRTGPAHLSLSVLIPFFVALRFLPKGEKIVVLGLISSKIPQLEDKEAIKARIAEASKFAPLNQLALSPQCGFSSTVHGNEITIEDQWAKMKLVHEIAQDIWGSDM